MSWCTKVNSEKVMTPLLGVPDGKGQIYDEGGNLLFDGIILEGIPTAGILYHLPRIYKGKLIIPNRNNYKFIYKKTELFIKSLRYENMLLSYSFEGEIRNYAADVTKIIGSFPYHQQSLLQGIFYLKSKDGKVYIGSMKDSKRHGFGLMILPNGHSMMGYWQEGSFKGIYKCPPVVTERMGASLHNPVSSHVGIQTDSNELLAKKPTLSKHNDSVSHFESAKRVSSFNRIPVEVKGFFKIVGDTLYLSDYGHIMFQDGSMYKGEISKNRMSGFGIMNYSTGEYYEGLWKNNQPNGIGKFSSDVFTFEGQFMNGVWQGFGILRLKLEGKTIKGEWDKGKLKYALVDDLKSNSNLLQVEKMTVKVAEESDFFKTGQIDLTGVTQVFFKDKPNFSSSKDKAMKTPQNKPEMLAVNPAESIIATNTYGLYSEIAKTPRTQEIPRPSTFHMSYQPRGSIYSRLTGGSQKQLQFIGVFERNRYTDLEGFSSSQLVGIGYITRGNEVIFKGVTSSDFSKFFGSKFDHDTETEMKGYFNFNLKLTGIGEMIRGNTRYVGTFRKNYKSGLVKKSQDRQDILIAEYEDDKKNGFVLKIQPDGLRVLTEYSFNKLKKVYYNR